MPPTKILFGIVVPNLGGLSGGIVDVGVMFTEVEVVEEVEQADPVEGRLP